MTATTSVLVAAGGHNHHNNPNGSNNFNSPSSASTLSSSSDARCWASIDALGAEIESRFARMKEFAALQLGLDIPPVHLTMLETLYRLKMSNLHAETQTELAKFDYSSLKCEQHKGFKKLKVCLPRCLVLLIQWFY